MKLKNLVDERFKATIVKLVGSNLSMKMSFKIADIVDELNSELSKYDKVRKDSLKKYVKTKENGEFDLDANGSVVFNSQEDSSKFFKEHEDLLNEDVNISKIKKSDLIQEDLKIKPEEIAFLKEILEN